MSALRDLVDGEPGHLLDLDGVRREHPGGDLHHVLAAHRAHARAVLVGDLAEIDIEAHHVPALTRNEHDAPARRLDRGLQADVGEVGDRQDVEHAPGVVGDVAPQLETDRLSDDAARSVAADDVAGVDGEALIATGEPDPDRVAAARPDVETLAADPIVGREPVHGAAHDSEQMLEHPRLVDDDMREFRQLVVGVLGRGLIG